MSGISAGGGASSSRSVFHLTHELHQTVTRSIDTALSWDQLNSPSVNYTLVRPIVERFVQLYSGEKTADGGGGLLHTEVTEAERGRKEGGGSGDVQLGAVLYALMANRYVSSSCGDERRDPRGLGTENSAAGRVEWEGRFPVDSTGRVH